MIISELTQEERELVYRAKAKIIANNNINIVKNSDAVTIALKHFIGERNGKNKN